MQSNTTGTLKWIDAHSHLTEEQVVQTPKKAEIGWVLGGIEPEEWKRQLKMKAQWPDRIFPVFGLHPWWIHTATWEKVWEGLGQLQTELPKAVALGETGLDAYKDRAATLPMQLDAFKSQVELAKKLDKPLVLHIVAAHTQAREVLKHEGTGIIHSFSGSLEDAKYYSDRGFHISVSGTVLKDGHKGLKAAVQALPLDKIVIETDSGDPMEFPVIAEAVAKIKKIRVETVLETSTENVKSVFRL